MSASSRASRAGSLTSVPAQIGSGDRSGQVRSGQVRSGQVRSGQVVDLLVHELLVELGGLGGGVDGDDDVADLSGSGDPDDGLAGDSDRLADQEVRVGMSAQRVSRLAGAV